MNPFTRFLNQWSQDNSLTEFIAYWDRLEGLVVQVYREKRAVNAAEDDFAEVWAWLRQNYGRWLKELRPYWQQTSTGGAPTKTDPFQLLLDIEAPAAILGNWPAMQHLPAAREALNLCLRQQESS